MARPREPEERPPRSSGPTRRAFLKGLGVKAMYTTPVVLTLAAQPALADYLIYSWCLPPGATCLNHGECCLGVCENNMGTKTCL